MIAFKFNAKTVPALTRFEALHCIPVKNAEVKESLLQNGDMLLMYPLCMPAVLRKLFRRHEKAGRKVVYSKKLQLDVLGTAVWQQIDGSRSVAAIIQWFADTYRLHPSEAETAVTQFLRDLGQRGLIGLSDTSRTD